MQKAENAHASCCFFLAVARTLNVVERIRFRVRLGDD